MRMAGTANHAGCMLETRTPGHDGPDELLVRGYLSALNTGRFLDALNAFSMDASLRDETGHERHGIREIAAAFARRERPLTLEIEDLERDGDTVNVRLRMSFPKSRTEKSYRSVFRVERDRIHSLEIDLMPASRSPKRPIARSA